MITPDGWLSWAARLEPTNRHVNPGVNPVKGVFLHSAEGYAGALLDPTSVYGYNGQFSWHFTNLMDGRFYQHYPFTANCHHATSANNLYVGGEQEGYKPNEPTLTEAQIINAVHVIQDLSAWKGWVPKRPTSPTDISHTLWEHNEVVRIGGTSTSCPSGRIPWPEILRRLGQVGPAPTEEVIMQHEAWGAFFRGLQIGPNGRQAFNAYTDFALPVGSKYVEVEFLLARGYGVVYNGNGTQAGRFGGPPTPVQTPSFSAPIRIWLNAEGWFEIHAEDPNNPIQFCEAHAVARG